MSHLVIFTSADNSAGFEPCNDLRSAAAAVERLRNDQGIDNARIFRLEEVKFEVKTYYKIEVAESAKAPTNEVAVTAVDEKAAPPHLVAPAASVPVAPETPAYEPVVAAPVEIVAEAAIDAPAAAVSSVAAEMATLMAAPVVATPLPAVTPVNESDELADLEASAMGQRRGLFGR